MHGRTANKEIDPGRYLRWMRSGIATCAVDLPGHGERGDEPLDGPEHTLQVLTRMQDEIDSIVQALRGLGVFDMNRLAIGGMSAGGMVTLARLCTDHPFVCATVESTTGAWTHPSNANMFPARYSPLNELLQLDPVGRLDHWRQIPLLAIHSARDELVSIEGQRRFIEVLRDHYTDPSLIEFIEYPETGAPAEHAHFGKMARDARERQLAFLTGHLKL